MKLDTSKPILPKINPYTGRLLPIILQLDPDNDVVTAARMRSDKLNAAFLTEAADSDWTFDFISPDMREQNKILAQLQSLNVQLEQTRSSPTARFGSQGTGAIGADKVRDLWR